MEGYTHRIEDALLDRKLKGNGAVPLSWSVYGKDKQYVTQENLFLVKTQPTIYGLYNKMLYICIQNNNNLMMQTTSTKVQTAFRFEKELIKRLKIKAKKENRSLNNYVETILMDVVYDEPNEETLSAINEVKSGKTLERLNMGNFDEFVAGL